MAANDNKSFLNYLNKLVDEYNNSNHCSIGKKTMNVSMNVELINQRFKQRKNSWKSL